MTGFPNPDLSFSDCNEIQKRKEIMRKNQQRWGKKTKLTKVSENPAMTSRTEKKLEPQIGKKKQL